MVGIPQTQDHRKFFKENFLTSTNVKMFFSILILFQTFIVKTNPLQLRPRALNDATCRNQSAYNWMVSIQRDKNHTCNGVIMESNAILTTAFCCKEKLNCSREGPNPHLRVVHRTEAQEGFPTGIHCTKDDLCHSTISSVLYCILHPQYVKEKNYIEYDTAIVVLVDHLSSVVEAPLYEELHYKKDFSEVCNKGLVVGWWFHFDQKEPNSKLECFPVTVRSLPNCAEVIKFVYLRRSHNLTLTCSYDASNRFEVCKAFYGAPLICDGKVVGLVSHKYNFSEECLQVSPFYYTRMDWSLCFRAEWYLENQKTMSPKYKTLVHSHCSKDIGGRIKMMEKNSLSYAHRVMMQTRIICIFLIINYLLVVTLHGGMESIK